MKKKTMMKFARQNCDNCDKITVQQLIRKPWQWMCTLCGIDNNYIHTDVMTIRNDNRKLN